jgi:hypothetical protein
MPGAGCRTGFRWQNPPMPLTVAMHWFQVEKPQFDAPPPQRPLYTAHQGSGS